MTACPERAGSGKEIQHDGVAHRSCLPPSSAGDPQLRRVGFGLHETRLVGKAQHLSKLRLVPLPHGYDRLSLQGPERSLGLAPFLALRPVVFRVDLWARPSARTPDLVVFVHLVPASDRARMPDMSTWPGGAHSGRPFSEHVCTAMYVPSVSVPARENPRLVGSRRTAMSRRLAPVTLSLRSLGRL